MLVVCVSKDLGIFGIPQRKYEKKTNPYNLRDCDSYHILLSFQTLFDHGLQNTFYNVWCLRRLLVLFVLNKKLGNAFCVHT
jgi:hypothetical protein